MSTSSEPSTSTSNESPDTVKGSTLFSKLEPSVRDNQVGASLGPVWMPGVAWDGVAALFATDDAVAERGLVAFITELMDHVDVKGGWQNLLNDIAVAIEAG